MRTLWGSATDRGLVRMLNEDSLLAYPPVFLVADGMGGHDAGDVASRIVVEEFSLLLGRDAATADQIHDAFARSAARLRETVGDRMAGTTVAGAAVVRQDGTEYWLVFNIGDSRVYRLAEGQIEQISVDHSVVQELLDANEISLVEARVHPERHVITRALGTAGPPDPDYWLLPVGSTDRLLICSDGLTTELDEAELVHGLTQFVDPQQAADWLVAAAVDAGGRDNATAVVVDVAASWNDVAAQEETVRRGESPPRARTGDEGEPWDTAVHGATVPTKGRQP
ncbi:MAG: PP2C family protein-serine/threonine phosphatase [Cellulomonadaceae bacterium]